MINPSTPKECVAGGPPMKPAAGGAFVLGGAPIDGLYRYRHGRKGAVQPARDHGGGKRPEASCRRFCRGRRPLPREAARRRGKRRTAAWVP